jgi:uncharacterized damage-inducible protein DinB
MSAYFVNPETTQNTKYRKGNPMKLSELFSHWNQVHADTLVVLDKFSEDELSYVAYPGGMTVGRIALHIADAKDGWFQRIFTRERADWPENYTLENYPSKAAIAALLTAVHTQIFDQLDGLTQADLDTQVDSPWGTFSLRFILWHILEHEIHHRGELSLVLGLLGREGLQM